jgi:cystathionine gamma-synthase
VVVAAGRPAPAARAPLNTPIALSTTFHHGPDDNYYLRQGSSDTIRCWEQAAGSLDGGDGLAFASGMAAIAAVVEGMPAGTVAVVPNAAYSGTITIFNNQRELGRMELRPVDITDTDAVLAALPGAGLVWLETVTNPMIGVVDVPTIAAAARAAGALVCVDATFSTPLVTRPLEQGADVVMHSATKYLSGHSDVLMGLLVTHSAELGTRLRSRRDITGAIPGSLECFLALRGLRTLALRLDRAQSNAGELALRLAGHPSVTRVRYPGLPGDAGHELAARLHDGFGAMLSFELGTAEQAEQLCRAVRLITHATSLGGVESLIERRARHAVDAAAGTPASLLRLSVGIEHVEDLWDDLAQALTATA